MTGKPYKLLGEFQDIDVKYDFLESVNPMGYRWWYRSDRAYEKAEAMALDYILKEIEDKEK